MKQPIDIAAESLEVLQEKKQAIFTGNVVAVQGNVTLKSDKMTVFYKERARKQTSAPESGVPGGDAIEKIVVDGNVFLTTPEETAKGAHGVYRVTEKRIDLNDNVVLTRQKNVLKGEHLTYDLVTGQSKLVSAPGSGGGQGRVRALFVPEEKTEQKKP